MRGVCKKRARHHIIGEKGERGKGSCKKYEIYKDSVEKGASSIIRRVEAG